MEKFIPLEILLQMISNITMFGDFEISPFPEVGIMTRTTKGQGKQWNLVKLS